MGTPLAGPLDPGAQDARLLAPLAVAPLGRALVRRLDSKSGLGGFDPHSAC